MQDMNWNDLQYSPGPVAQRVSMAGAARRAGPERNHRLPAACASLEEPERASTLLHPGAGPWALRSAKAGRRRWPTLPREWKVKARAIQTACARDASGTSPPGASCGSPRRRFIVNRLIVPGPIRFSSRCPSRPAPGTLLPDGRDYALDRHEADLALRLARPTCMAVTRSQQNASDTSAYAAFAPPRHATPKRSAGSRMDNSLSPTCLMPRWLAAQTPHRPPLTVSDHEHRPCRHRRRPRKIAATLACREADPRCLRPPVPAENLPRRDLSG